LPAAAARARKAEAGQAHSTNGDDNDAPLGGKGTDND
ncbi:RNA methyltransferase, partial [Mesorhizobium sp. M4A.F.Ca.ET.090.04.2.1]